MSDMGTKEAAAKWGVSQQTASKYCRNGWVPGATHDAPRSPWHIPKDVTYEQVLQNKNKSKN